MNIILLSPIARELLTDAQVNRLQALGSLTIIEAIQPLQSIQELCEGGQEPLILAIDPDFCDWKITRDDIAKMTNVKAIVLQTTSFSYVDVAFCRERGITVVNLPGFSSNAVAEWAIMAALNLARKIPLLIKDRWKLDFVEHRGMELRGKTAGIIGLGRIGKLVAETCQGLGMQVHYWSRQTRDERFTYTELTTLFSTADLVFLCLPSNEQTSSLISDDMLTSMKKSALFVRTGFAPNHQLLLSMVENGHLSGYAFGEDTSTFSECVGNVWASPPNAWLTKESVQRNAEQWVEAIVSANRGDFPTAVN